MYSKDFRRKEKYCVNHFSYGNFKLWSFKARMTLKIICYSYFFFENAIQLTLILFSPHCSCLPLSDLHLLPTVSPYAYGWGWAVISSNTPLLTLRTVEGVKILCSQTNARNTQEVKHAVFFLQRKRCITCFPQNRVGTGKVKSLANSAVYMSIPLQTLTNRTGVIA